jgi:hypothetical protein
MITGNKRKIDIQAEEKGINQIMDKVIENTDISYQLKIEILLKNNNIVNNGADQFQPISSFFSILKLLFGSFE